MIASHLSKRHIGQSAKPSTPTGFGDDDDYKKDAKADRSKCLKQSLFAFILIVVVLGALYFFFEETNSLLHKHTEYKIIHRPEARKQHVKRVHEAVVADCNAKISRLEAKILHPDCSEADAHVLSLKHEIDNLHEQMGDIAHTEMELHEVQNKLTVMEEAEHTLQMEVQELRKQAKGHNKVVQELADSQSRIYSLEKSKSLLDAEVKRLEHEAIERSMDSSQAAAHARLANELADAQTRIHNLEETERELRAQMSHMENIADSHKDTADGHAKTIESLQESHDLMAGHLQQAKAESAHHASKAHENMMLANMHEADATFHKSEAERHKADADTHQREKQEMVHPQALEAAHAQLESLQARATHLENENEAHRQNAHMEKTNAEHHEKTSKLAQEALERLTGRPAYTVLAEQDDLQKQKELKQKKCDLLIHGSAEEHLNGCFALRPERVNGFNSYYNAGSDKVLYWRTDHHGEWVIADDVTSSHLRAYISGQGTESPAGDRQWLVQRPDQKWTHETLYVRQPEEESDGDKATSEPQCENGINVAGAKVQTAVNGCYKRLPNNVNAFASFRNEKDKVLYWHPDHGGQWVVATAVKTGYLAFLGSQKGQDLPLGLHEWHTLDKTGKAWKAEVLHIVSSETASDGDKATEAEASNDAPPTGCSGGMVVSECVSQIQINGCFKNRNEVVNGFASYKNEHGKVLYWHPNHGGQWVISDTVGNGFRAYATGQGPQGPHTVPKSDWHVTKESKWIAEGLLIQEV